MTMIVGLNLSDRLYLAADTRASFSDGTKKDDALKILPLLDRVVYPKNNIAVAVAGHVTSATFFREKIYSALSGKKLSGDIRAFYTEIEGFLDAAIVEWVDAGRPLDADCCLLFAGIYEGRNKIVSEEKLTALVAEYKNSRKEHANEKGPKLEELVASDPTWKMINEKMKKEAGMSVMENLAMSNEPTIPEHLKAVIETHISELKDVPDSLIFSAKVIIRERKVLLEKAEWGEWLAYGDRVSKNSIPSETMSLFEFYRGREKNVPHLVEGAILNTAILDFARDQKIGSIGGTVIVCILDKKGLMIGGKDLIFEERNTRVKVNGQELPLIPFNQYNRKNGSQATAEL